MHIVFPEGSGCVQKPEDLAFVKGIGTVDYYETPPRTRQTSSSGSGMPMQSFSTTRSWMRR